MRQSPLTQPAHTHTVARVSFTQSCTRTGRSPIITHPPGVRLVGLHLGQILQDVIIGAIQVGAGEGGRDVAAVMCVDWVQYSGGLIGLMAEWMEDGRDLLVPAARSGTAPTHPHTHALTNAVSEGYTRAVARRQVHWQGSATRPPRRPPTLSRRCSSAGRGL